MGKQTASGVDVDLRLRSAPSAFGRFGVGLSASYLADWQVSYDGVNEIKLVGEYDSGDGSYPRWQHTLTLDWERKPWAATLVQTWRAGYTDDNFNLLGGDAPREMRPTASGTRSSPTPASPN